MKSSRKQRLAAFEAAKIVVMDLVENLAGSWADMALSDDEIHRISDAALEAALNVENGNDD